MRNLLNVNTTKKPYILEYANSACETNSIEMYIYVGNLKNPYLEFTKVDGTIINTDILEIENNFINYDIPFSYYSTNGTINMRVRAEGFDSSYIGFTIPNNLSSNDNVIVKIENDKYLVKTMSPYKYHDLPIANKNGRLGVVTIGDNLVIDNNGRLSSTGGGLAATVTVGTTVTGEAGTNASVSNSGTANAAILDFVIPKGSQGDKGEIGTTPNIQIGNVNTLDAGKSATVSVRGTAEEPILDFGIPKGKDGTGAGTTNYNELNNKPVTNLTSEDSANPIVLFNLEEGTYNLYGYIKYYPTYEGTTAITSPTLVTVQKSSTTTYIQMLEPYSNDVIGYEITENSYRKLNGLIAEYTVSNTTTNEITFNNLDIQPNEIYDIRIVGTSTVVSDIAMTINDYTGIYYQMGKYANGTNTSSDASFSQTYGYRPDKSRFYYCVSLRPQMTIIESQLSLELNPTYSKYYPFYRWRTTCLWSGYQLDADCFGVSGVPTTKITKINFKLENGYYGQGTKIQIVKKRKY